MFKCEYCDRELKSKAGKVRHESSCMRRSMLDEIEVQPVPDGFGSQEIIKITTKLVEGVDYDKAITLEVLGSGGHYSNGTDNKYYEDHPRRLVKLQGLLSRTRDENERIKIIQMIVKLRNEHN